MNVRRSSGAGPPEAVRRNAEFVSDLRICLKRAKPRLAASLRDQLIGIVKHHLAWKLRGHREIFPGMARLAHWAGVSERQARENMRTLECWSVVKSVAYARGGRRSTRYTVDLWALFRALVDLGCNPSSKLRSFMRGNTEVDGCFMKETQNVSHIDAAHNAGRTSGPVRLHDLAAGAARNPEENPEVSSAGIQRESAPSGLEPNVVRLTYRR